MHAQEDETRLPDGRIRCWKCDGGGEIADYSIVRDIAFDYDDEEPPFNIVICPICGGTGAAE
jgi:hypothetical protein